MELTVRLARFHPLLVYVHSVVVRIPNQVNPGPNHRCDTISNNLRFVPPLIYPAYLHRRLHTRLGRLLIYPYIVTFGLLFHANLTSRLFDCLGQACVSWLWSKPLFPSSPSAAWTHERTLFPDWLVQVAWKTAFLLCYPLGPISSDVLSPHYAHERCDIDSRSLLTGLLDWYAVCCSRVAVLWNGRRLVSRFNPFGKLAWDPSIAHWLDNDKATNNLNMNVKLKVSPGDQSKFCICVTPDWIVYFVFF